MTIFHVIKYPISWPPTEEQLSVLPPKLYKKWLRYATGWRVTNPPLTIANFYKSCSLSGALTEKWSGEINKLRKMIREYEE